MQKRKGFVILVFNHQFYINALCNPHFNHEKIPVEDTQKEIRKESACLCNKAKRMRQEDHRVKTSLGYSCRAMQQE
jgi:hypothetical protein